MIDVPLPRVQFMTFALDEYHKMDKRRRDNLKQLFLEADDDASGRLDYTEFQALIKQINPEKTQAEVAHMFRKVCARSLHLCNLSLSLSLCLFPYYISWNV
jgi:Ca2+-binding EF-hand superfamily protein